MARYDAVYEGDGVMDDGIGINEYQRPAFLS
jgi:hypothetical protein